MEDEMGYQSEREECIARLTREGLPLSAIRSLLKQATTINRLAELACSSEAADRDRVPCPAACRACNGRGTVEPENGNAAGICGPCKGSGATDACLCDGDHDNSRRAIPRIRLQDHQAEQRAIRAVPAGWRVLTSGDPRGYTLRVVPPSYAERNAGRPEHDLDAIGVPAGPSRIRW
jgi:hypothetical protein